MGRAGGSLGAAGRGDGGEQVPNRGARLGLGGGAPRLSDASAED